jgi:hypothetical protein
MIYADSYRGSDEDVAQVGVSLMGLLYSHGLAVFYPDLFEFWLGTVVDLLAAVVLSLLEVQQELDRSELLPELLHFLTKCLCLMEGLTLLGLDDAEDLLDGPNFAEERLPEDLCLGGAHILFEAFQD